jgi:ERCC4-related helicase
MKITDYHAKYFAYELTKRCASDSIEKISAPLADAKVDLKPNQIEAAIFAFRSPLSKGALLADEVGLGKTIEAGLVVSQKWSEKKRKILIIAPANLRKQWSEELFDKFYLPSTILESKSFNKSMRLGRSNPFDQEEIVITSYNFAANKSEYLQLISWDLIVIDEAHRLRNVYKPSNITSNKLLSAIKNYPKILLTATPLQNSLLELFGLTLFIDDQIFGDKKSFQDRFAYITNKDQLEDLKSRLNKFCIRALRKNVKEYINYTDRHSITQKFNPSDKEQELYELVSEYLRKEKLYALPPSHRHLITLHLRKLLGSSSYAVALTLDKLVKKLNQIIKENESEEQEVSLFEDIDEIEEYFDEEEDTAEATDKLTQEDIANVKQEILEIEKYRDLAESIEHNAKADSLLMALGSGFKALDKRANKKAIIFTESLRTQKYLFNFLNKDNYAGKVMLFNGSNNDEQSGEIYENWLRNNANTDRISDSKSADKRAALVDYFREDAEIMIATEAAAEGINLQFCSMVINYDLPWNPQRIEQRIGRCHRYGQKSDVIVVNFLNLKNEAEQRILELLQEKFKLFDGVFGASDQILGNISSGIDFEKRIFEILQKCRTTDEINDAFTKLKEEKSEEIETKVKKTQQSLFEAFDEDVRDKLKLTISQTQEWLSKYENWLWILTKHSLGENAVFDDEKFSFDLMSNPFNKNVNTGKYLLKKEVEGTNTYRLGHPLSQEIIDVAKRKTLSKSKIIFDYSNSSKHVSLVGDLLGKQGYLALDLVTVESLEESDHLLFSAVTSDGKKIDQESCQKLFSLPCAREAEINGLMDLSEVKTKTQKELLIDMKKKDEKYFQEEVDKINRFCDDLLDRAEKELKDAKIKARDLIRESKVATHLEEQKRIQEELQKWEREKRKLRQRIFDVEDEIEEKRKALIDSIEYKLEQKIAIKPLFEIEWEVA